MRTTIRAFWIYDEYDRAFASDGVSRYGAYIRDRIGEFDLGFYDDPDIRRNDFAANAWRIATGPIMSPGYVESHQRILSARVDRSHWDGSLVATVDVAMPAPAALERTAPGRRPWQGWDHPNFFGPDDKDVTRDPYALTTTRLFFPVPAGDLPPAPSEPGPWLEETARLAVDVLVAELDAVLVPVLTAVGGA